MHRTVEGLFFLDFLPILIYNYIMLNKLKSLIKQYKKTSILIALIILGGAIFIAGREEKTAGKIVKVQLGTISQGVSATGRVEPSQAVDLSFDRPGRIIFVAAKTGDKVRPGQLLIQLESSELFAQKQRELANLSAAQVRLDQIRASADTTDLDNSLIVSTLSGAVKTITDMMADFTKNQYAYFSGFTGEANSIADAKESVLYSLYSQPNLGRVLTWYFLSLNSGLKRDISDVENGVFAGDVDTLVERTREALLKTKFALELLNSALSNTSEASATDKAIIKTAVDLVIAQLASLTTKNKSLLSQTFDIRLAQAQLEQARASLAFVDAQIAKNSLRAPFAGVITDVRVELGEVVSGAAAVSMISNGKYQIEVNISEADITKINVGNSAMIRFDAYGSDANFDAEVVHINPAASVTNGIAVYGVTLEFANQDSRILPGLTADIDIQTNKKENVLYIPSRNIMNRDGKKYVNLLVDDKATDNRFANLSVISNSKTGRIYEVEIQTGLKGSDGRIEVISGLKEGDQISND